MLKRVLRKALNTAGIGVARVDELDRYRSLDNSLLLYSELPQGARELIAPLLPHSKAQLAQDLFAVAFANTNSPKFFVEFGATDGVSLSNTWLLEKN